MTRAEAEEQRDGEGSKAGPSSVDLGFDDETLRTALYILAVVSKESNGSW